jgi:hypothetical protein
VLEHSQSIFVSSLKNNSLHASYDIWHAHLGHVSHSVISLLNKKKGYLSITSLLPSPNLCFSCQTTKSHKLPFNANDQRVSHVLNLIHYDIRALLLLRLHPIFVITLYLLMITHISHGFIPWH